MIFSAQFKYPYDDYCFVKSFISLFVHVKKLTLITKWIGRKIDLHFYLSNLAFWAGINLIKCHIWFKAFIVLWITLLVFEALGSYQSLLNEHP